MTARDSPDQRGSGADHPGHQRRHRRSTGFDAGMQARPAPRPADRPRRARLRRRELALLVLLALRGAVPAGALAGRFDAAFSMRTWRVEARRRESCWCPARCRQLQALNGTHLERISAGEGADVPTSMPAVLHRSPRWSVDDATARSTSSIRSSACRPCWTRARCTLHFAGGQRGRVWNPDHAAWPASEPLFSLLGAVALALVPGGAVVLISHPQLAQPALCADRRCARVATCWPSASRPLPGLGLPPAYAQHGLLGAHGVRPVQRRGHGPPVRHCSPCACPRGRWIALAAWSACDCAAGCWRARQAADRWPGGGPRPACSAAGVLTMLLMTWSYQLEPNPFATADAAAGWGGHRHAAAAQRRRGRGLPGTEASLRAMPHSARSSGTCS